MIFQAFFGLLILVAMKAQGDPTCPERDGEQSVYFPGDDCSDFWVCSNGIPFLFQCPEDLQFNPIANVCDWPDRAGCDNSDDSEDSSDSDSDSSSESNSSESPEDQKIM